MAAREASRQTGDRHGAWCDSRCARVREYRSTASRPRGRSHPAFDRGPCGSGDSGNRNGTPPEGEAPCEGGSYEVICSKETDVVDLLHAYSKHCDGHPPAELVLKAAQSRRPGRAAPRARSARQLRPSEIDELVVYYLEVGNVAEVARHFGVTRQTVGSHLAVRGIETVRRMSEADISTAAALYREGRSAATIGRRLGFDGQTVLTSLRSVGVTIRPRPGYARPTNPLER